MMGSKRLRELPEENEKRKRAEKRRQVLRRIFRIGMAIMLFLIFLLSIIGSVILFAYPAVAVQKQAATSPSPSPTMIAYKTPTPISIPTVVPRTAITGTTVGTDSELLSVIVGGIIGIVGAAAGSLVSYWLESKREERRERMNNVREALEWVQKERKESLRRADLYGADLRGVDLAGADLAFANLRHADLTEANLQQADLRGADLRGANLSRARVAGANLEGAKAWGANLTGCDLMHTRHPPQVSKPSGSFERPWQRVWQGVLGILRKYWKFWENHRLSLGSEEVLYRLTRYTAGLAAEVSSVWVHTMLLSDCLLVAVAVALIVSRGAWLMALVVITGVVILNILLPTWELRCCGDSSWIRMMLQINTVILVPAIAWILWESGWVMVVSVIAGAFILNIPLLIWHLGDREFQLLPIWPFIVLVSVPVGIDLAVGLVVLRSAWEAAMAVVGGIFVLGNLWLFWKCLAKSIWEYNLTGEKDGE